MQHKTFAKLAGFGGIVVAALVAGNDTAHARPACSFVVGVVTELGQERLTISSEQSGAVSGVIDPESTRVTRSGSPARPTAIHIADHARARLDIDGQWIVIDLVR